MDFVVRNMNDGNISHLSYWPVYEEFAEVMMPVSPIRTVLICKGYLVWITPKQIKSQIPVENVH